MKNDFINKEINIYIITKSNIIIKNINKYIIDINKIIKGIFKCFISKIYNNILINKLYF